MPSLIPWRISRIKTLVRYLPSSARRAFEERLELCQFARARSAALDVGDFGKLGSDLANRQRRLGLRGAQLEQHADRVAEIFRRVVDVFALILGAGHRGDDFPNRAAADLQPLLLALLERAAYHEARRDFRLINFEAREELADRLSAICSRLPVWLSDWQTSRNPETTPPRELTPRRQAGAIAARRYHVKSIGRPT